MYQLMHLIKNRLSRTISSRWPKKAGACGTIDSNLRGWFNDQNGELAKNFVICEQDTVVDVGCGDGAASVFAASFGADVIATDIDPRIIEKLKERMIRKTQQTGSFQAFVSDSNPLPIADRTASKVISMEVMEHVDDPQQFLSELVRIGKPGASYLITVPDPVAESIQQKVAPACYWQKPNHLRVFQRDEIDRVVEETGLQIVHHTYTGFFDSIWWILFWASDHDARAPQGPILEYWTRTWYALMQSPKGDVTRKALDDFMPKSQVIIARKAA